MKLHLRCKHFRHIRPFCLSRLYSCRGFAAYFLFFPLVKLIRQVGIVILCEMWSLEANSPFYVTWRPLTRSHANRCKSDWVISGLGGCRPPLCGRGEEVLINRLVAMLMSHTFAGTVPNSSWIAHCFSCQLLKLDVCSVAFEVKRLT